MSSSPFRRTRQRAPWIALSASLLGVLALVWWYAIGRPARAREHGPYAAIAKGQECLKKGQPRQALGAVARIPVNGPWAAGVLTVKGLAFAALDRPQDARPLLEQSLKLDQKQPMAAKVLAAVYFSSNETDRGFQMLALAARLDPDDFRPWYAAGDVYLTVRNQPEEAVKVFKQALLRRPNDDESRIGLIDALLASGSATDVKPLLDAILPNHPSDPRILCLVARFARYQGQLDEMGTYAERALAVDPDSVEALVLRAEFLHHTGHDQEALSHAERAVALHSDNLAALSLLAVVQGSLGLKDRSVATSERHRIALERSEQIQQLSDQMRQRPNDPEPRWKLGRAAAEGGMTNMAIRCFQAALALDPNCQPARAGLMALSRSGTGSTP